MDMLSSLGKSNIAAKFNYQELRGQKMDFTVSYLLIQEVRFLSATQSSDQHGLAGSEMFILEFLF